MEVNSNVAYFQTAEYSADGISCLFPFMATESRRDIINGRMKMINELESLTHISDQEDSPKMEC